MKNYRFILLIFITCISYNQTNAAIKGCADLQNLNIADALIHTAETVKQSKELPEFCRVAGTIKNHIRYEVRLPTTHWNGKFYMTGCGSFCGQVSADRPKFVNAINYGLKRNYAVSTTDSGHSSDSRLDARWAYNNREAEHNWGHLAVTKTANLTKTIIREFYGKAQSYSYFQGCSTGGRMAVMEAIRYPQDFDGIISGAPALNYVNIVATYLSWLVQNNHDKYGNEIITNSDIEIVEKHLYEKCDKLDAVEDKLISYPPICQFNPKDLLCRDTYSQRCLEEKKVYALEKLYSPPTDSKGNILTPSKIPVGGEANWKTWFISQNTNSPTENHKKVKIRRKNTSLIPTINEQFLRYMAFEEDPGDTFTSYDFNFDVHPQLLSYMGDIYNADNPNLQDFRALGGKMILWHGWSDILASPYMTINYYEKIISHFGSLQKAQSTARLFLFPGMSHCGVVPGPGPQQDGFDLLTALENWVEKGNPPTTINVTNYNQDSSVKWTRPTCAFPLIATYKGVGDTALPENYICSSPPN